jgi:ribosomal protein S18 acetylase RimI-like enzyme
MRSNVSIDDQPPRNTATTVTAEINMRGDVSPEERDAMADTSTNDMPPSRVEGRVFLTDAETADVERLAAVCNAHDATDLKLGLPRTPRDVETPRAFVCYSAGTLIGYASIDGLGGGEPELCGMVHPDDRRRGIGQTLLSAIRDTLRAVGDTRALLIIEDASAAGLAFASSLGTRLASKELHLELDPADIPSGLDRAPATQAGPLTVRPAAPTPTDVTLLVGIMSRAFGDPEDRVRARVEAEIRDPEGPFLIAEVDGRPVGSLKTYRMGPETGLYALGILHEARNHGLGRQMLARTFAYVLAEGPTRFVLEVDDDNVPAKALYSRCGFVETTVYGYYALDV